MYDLCDMQNRRTVEAGGSAKLQWRHLSDRTRRHKCRTRHSCECCKAFNEERLLILILYTRSAVLVIVYSSPGHWFQVLLIKVLGQDYHAQPRAHQETTLVSLYTTRQFAECVAQIYAKRQRPPGQVPGFPVDQSVDLYLEVKHTRSHPET